MHPVTQPVAAVPEYRLKLDDVLDVKFTYALNYDDTVRVRPDGKITLRGIGDVQAQGRTCAELAISLESSYARLLRRPEVVVSVKTAALDRIYVGGEVTLPGPVQTRESLTALQAILRAGGVTNSAELRTVVVLRDQGTDVPKFILLDLHEGLTRAGASQDMLLADRDIVFVPMSRVAKANQFVAEYIDRLIPIGRSASVSYNWTNILEEKGR